MYLQVLDTFWCVCVRVRVCVCVSVSVCVFAFFSKTDCPIALKFGM